MTFALQKGRLAPVPEKRNHTSPWSPWECHLFCRPDHPAHAPLPRAIPRYPYKIRRKNMSPQGNIPRTCGNISPFSHARTPRRLFRGIRRPRKATFHAHRAPNPFLCGRPFPRPRLRCPPCRKPPSAGVLTTLVFLYSRAYPPTTGRSDPAPPADAEQIGRLRIPFPRAAHLRPAAPYTSARALRRGDLAGRFCPSTAPAAAFSRRIPCPASLSDSLNETLVTSASDRHRMKFVRIFGS